ncbi:hypothetical protein UJ101_01514 [Flavobacteriaceae bacterium UJ101]|nr:hypothetical protein UJ101_01514 [Flavobacteriaceae bacterium UJ101]
MKINRINKILIPSFVGLTLLVSTSCESDVNDLNTSPNSFSSVDASLQIGTADLATVLLASSDASRMASIYSNHTVGAGAQWASIESYNITAGDFDNVWNNAYQQGLNQSRNVKVQAIANSENILAGRALVDEAMFLGELTAFFNDVPDVQATYNDNPVYDAQIEVLNSVQSKLDSASTYLGSNSVSSTGIASAGTWDEVIQSLKARYYLIQKDYANALTAAQSGISSSANDYSSVHADVAGQKNLWYQFEAEQRTGNIVGEGSYLYNLLDPANTTVTRNLATAGDELRFANYFNDGNVNTTGVFAADASFPIVSWYETKLIEAEAAHRTGDEGTALTALNEVRAALATEFGGEFPDASSSGDDLLKDILEEKYITLFCQTQVAHDLARTNNFIGVPAKTGADLPVRFLYPQVEINSNSNIPTTRPGIFVPTTINQ